MNSAQSRARGYKAYRRTMLTAIGVACTTSPTSRCQVHSHGDTRAMRTAIPSTRLAARNPKTSFHAPRRLGPVRCTSRQPQVTRRPYRPSGRFPSGIPARRHPAPRTTATTSGLLRRLRAVPRLAPETGTHDRPRPSSHRHTTRATTELAIRIVRCLRAVPGPTGPSQLSC